MAIAPWVWGCGAVTALLCYPPNTRASAGLVAAVAATVAGLVSGTAPDWLAHGWARVLHLPDDLVWGVRGTRPFNFDLVKPELIVGRWADCHNACCCQKLPGQLRTANQLQTDF